MVRINIAMEGVATQSGTPVVLAKGSICSPEKRVLLSRGHFEPIGWCTDLRRSDDGTLSMEFIPTESYEGPDCEMYYPVVNLSHVQWDPNLMNVVTSGRIVSIFLEPIPVLELGSRALSKSMQNNAPWPDMPTLAVE